MRSSRSLFLLTLVAAAAGVSALGLAACTGLKEAPLGGVDGGTPVSDAGAADALSDQDATTDGGSLPRPLDDTSCQGANSWAATTKSDAKCNGRVVRLLESWKGGDGAFGSTGTSIVRAVNGRTAIAVHRIQGPEAGELRIFAMPSTQEGFTVPPPFRVEGGDFTSAGVGVHLARGTNDDFHIAYQRLDDDSGGPIFYRKLLATGTLTAEENVTVLPKGCQPALAVSPKNDDAVVSYFIKPSQVATRTRVSGTFKPEVTVTQAITGTAPNTGASVPLYDLSGQAHIVYLFSSGSTSSSPKYVQSDGQFWTIASQTLDNVSSAGLFGFSLGFTIFGTTKHAAYFARPTNTAATELRIATWEGAGSFPTVQTVLQNVPIADPLSTPVDLHLAVDRFGAMHLVAVIPSSSSMCKITYLRQVPGVGDALKWVQDTIDEQPCVDRDDIRVSITVDDAIRAHIAYSVGGFGAYYATRYDRQ